jgi:glycosyltransferase involved in cell wall biosynthesis
MKDKITFLTFSLEHGGAEKVCVTLCNEFTNRNYETELWVMNYGETALSKKIDGKVKLVKLYHTHARKCFTPLLKLLLKNKPKKIIIFHIELALLVIILKRFLFLNTIIFVRSINTLSKAFTYPKGIWEKYIVSHGIKHVLPFANKIIAQSEGMYIDLKKLLKVKEKQLITIHNPAVLFSINGKNKLSNTAKKNEFLFIGRLNQQKGLESMLEALKIAVAKNSTVKLVIVGDGPEKFKLERIVSKHKLKDFVLFEGYQELTLPYFLKAKATLLTSHFEGFPNVLVESIAAGTPVVSFDCPSGPKDIIVPGVNGVLVPHLDIESFAKTILAIANSEITFSTQAVIETSKKFSIDSIVTQYERVFQEF